MAARRTADGNAGIIVTTKTGAAALSEEKIPIQILFYGYARADKAHMPEVPIMLRARP